MREMSQLTDAYSVHVEAPTPFPLGGDAVHHGVVEAHLTLDVSRPSASWQFSPHLILEPRLKLRQPHNASAFGRPQRHASPRTA